MKPFRMCRWFAVGLLLLAAWPGQAAEKPARLKVVTSFFPVYCFVAKVAGDRAEVQNLLGAGAGPHDYQASRRERQSLASADLVFVNGLGLEDWMQKLFRSSGIDTGKLVVLTAGLPPERLIFHAPWLEQEPRPSHRHAHDHDHDHDSANPHVWLDPTLAAHGVTNIVAAFKKADPANAAIYEANAARFLEELRSLDAELQERLKPFQGTPVVTFHNSFPYFTRRYGLELAGVVETVPDAGTSQRYMRWLYKVLREKKVKVIFTEPQFSNKLARQIAQDVGISTAPLDPLETGPLRPDAYLEGMRRNLATLVKVLSP